MSFVSRVVVVGSFRRRRCDNGNAVRPCTDTRTKSKAKLGWREFLSRGNAGEPRNTSERKRTNETNGTRRNERTKGRKEGRNNQAGVGRFHLANPNRPIDQTPHTLIHTHTDTHKYPHRYGASRYTEQPTDPHPSVLVIVTTEKRQRPTHQHTLTQEHVRKRHGGRYHGERQRSSCHILFRPPFLHRSFYRNTRHSVLSRFLPPSCLALMLRKGIREHDDMW